MGATVGAFGMAEAYSVSAGSHRGAFCVWPSSSSATRCRERLELLGFSGGGGCVSIWWYAAMSDGCICGVGSRDVLDSEAWVDLGADGRCHCGRDASEE